MKFTREAVQEAINLGKPVLPKFTAVELALCLGIPLIYVLRVIDANKDLFKFDAGDKTIIGLDARTKVQTMNSNEVWNWYLKNRLGGVQTNCLPLSDQAKLSSSMNSRVKWEKQEFAYYAATFATTDKTGSDVKDRIQRDYGKELAERATLLGVVGGNGQVPDRFLHGVIVTEDEVKTRKLCGINLYTPEWAMEAMLSEVDWNEVEVPTPRSGVSWIPKDQMITGEPETDAGESDTTAAQQAAVAAAAKMAGSKPPVPAEKKVNRRTKAQLDADRQKMVDDLKARGMFASVEIQKVADAATFGEAETLYKELLESLGNLTPPADQKPEEKLPAGAKQEELPGTAEARNAPPQSEAPMVVTPPAPTAGRSSMPTIASLETPPAPPAATVKDLKADIASKAGMPAPAPQSAPGIAPPPIATAPPAPTSGLPIAPPVTPAPVAAPPPAGATADATDLLNSLLKQTGQIS